MLFRSGVWQGSILSPVLFAVYLDGLLEELTASGFGGCLYAGAFVMPTILFYWLPAHQHCNPCWTSAVPMLPLINYASKTQLMCFHLQPVHSYSASIFFNGIQLQYTSKVSHLEHFLSPDLSDTDEILCVFKDLNCKANSILCITFTQQILLLNVSWL